ncbi:hypothetical protein [Agriterribacter sp.]|uniref:hypothetical protein n=1 Tax=Agriterribacter sp. TaxID=2821509 RepID=UPI002B96CF96|nr:hypothetical protein [Agriterribacter sp.]HRO45950.1 hypothetical protein [Agriterribacter sp.]HRQ19402.1 hypothetical protein [Agriterribacter sp.]
MQNPWRKLRKEGPYILEEDMDAVLRYNQKAKDNYKLMDELMPVPFVGNVLDSEIIILMLNPRYRSENKIKENENYKEKLIKVFNHEPVEYPFFFLDPNVVIGKKYWSSKLKGLKKIYKSEEQVSKNVSTIQLQPYHSTQFKLLKDIPSQKYNAYLVRKAIERKAFIIIARGKKHWLQLVPELESYNYFTLNSWRSPSISEKNCPKLFEVLKAQ